MVVGTPSDSGNITALGAKTEEVACWLDDTFWKDSACT